MYGFGVWIYPTLVNTKLSLSPLPIGSSPGKPQSPTETRAAGAARPTPISDWHGFLPFLPVYSRGQSGWWPPAERIRRLDRPIAPPLLRLARVIKKPLFRFRGKKVHVAVIRACGYEEPVVPGRFRRREKIASALLVLEETLPVAVAPAIVRRISIGGRYCPSA